MVEEIKENNIHLIIGEDDFLVENAAKKIISKVIPDDIKDSALEIIQGKADNEDAQLSSISDFNSSIMTPPFLDPVKLTWWRGVNFLPGGGTNGKISESVKSALEKIAQDLSENPLPQDQVIVITATKLLKASIFAKTFSKVAEVIEFASDGKKNKDKIASALMRLPELAEEIGITFNPGADILFIAKVGGDTRTIISELEKMKMYLGDEDRPVTKEDISEITSMMAGEPELWEVTSALCSHNAKQLLDVLLRFEWNNSFPILLLNVIEKSFREMIVIRAAYDSKFISSGGIWAKQIPPDQAELLKEAGFATDNNKNSWILRNLVKNACGFKNINILRRVRFRILQLREKVVSGLTHEFVLAELLRIAHG